MPTKTLSQMLLEGLEEWRKTGVLPNGEKWSPYEEKRLSAVKKFYVSSFTRMFCSKFNMNRQTAMSILKYLEDSGTIKITWQSPKGSYFILLKN